MADPVGRQFPPSAQDGADHDCRELNGIDDVVESGIFGVPVSCRGTDVTLRELDAVLEGQLLEVGDFVRRRHCGSVRAVEVGSGVGSRIALHLRAGVEEALENKLLLATEVAKLPDERTGLEIEGARSEIGRAREVAGRGRMLWCRVVLCREHEPRLRLLGPFARRGEWRSGRRSRR